MGFLGWFVDGGTVQDTRITFEYVLLFTQYLYDFFGAKTLVQACWIYIPVYPNIPLNIAFKLSNSEPIWTMFFHGFPLKPRPAGHHPRAAEGAAGHLHRARGSEETAGDSRLWSRWVERKTA